ncbi:hypothetical protein LN42_01930 [Marinitoga sp. 1137]|uniref:major capsid protein n=1 Tax=Marinitoga sp. 1137 TaxID=1545835 RepID=UPI000950A926|nr:major capsid protein [Marinitoga sp. 1137]APT75285.1 hypothetical protein LN42_01930 [Marinitoga sp. 1137]
MGAIDWKFLTELYRKTPVENYFLTKTLGKNKKFSPVPKVNIRTEDFGMTIASLGKVGDPAKPVKTTNTVTETMIDPAQIFEYDELTEDDIFANANPGVLALNGSEGVVSNKEYIRALKMEGLKRRVNRRIEQMFAQIISEGKISYNDGERKYEITFNNVTPVDYTLSSTTKIYKDLVNAADEIRKNGFAPDMIIMSKDVEAALFDNTQIKDMIKKQELNLARAQMQNEDALVRRSFEAVNIPPMYVYMGEYNDGTVKKYIPDGTLIMLSSQAFRLAFGAIVQFDVQPNGNPIMTDVLSWEKVTKDGIAKALYVMSRPLPYLINANALKIFNVTIS